MPELSRQLDSPLYYQVAVPRWLSQPLTYQFEKPPPLGSIVKVPLQQQSTWGLVIEPTTDVQRSTLGSKPIKTVPASADLTHPVTLHPPFLRLLIQVSRYYHYPLGLIFRMACPSTILNKVRTPSPPSPSPNSAKGLATLNDEQQHVLNKIQADLQQKPFHHHLIFGVTGSGKTEIYMHLAQRIFNSHAQKVLLVVPEIALTPQLVSRFQESLSIPTYLLHSGLTPAQHQLHWYGAFAPGPALIIGTRSALFHPLPELGLIIMDEEHDPSYKQNDHLHYHAREMMFFRSQIEDIPCIFGSATPSFELLHQAQQGMVHLHKLTQRYGGLKLPQIKILATHAKPTQTGWLSDELKTHIDSALQHGYQAMLYLNRKGFAPFLTCTHCATTLSCAHCDTTLTYYKKYQRCLCHICGYRIPPPQACLTCGSPFLIYRGIGTEALEEEVRQAFPSATLLRIDRDAITTFQKLHAALEAVESGRVDIVIGTQMLAKGHDFPKLRVVGILHGDQSLHLPDFRSVEWATQNLHQIAGRAGRRDIGEVFLQAYRPDHPLLHLITHESYETVFEQEMQKRKTYDLPPFTHLARFVFHVSHPDTGLSQLQPLWQTLQKQAPTQDIQIYPPTPCLRERIAKVYRLQLLIKAKSHAHLHQAIAYIRKWCDTQGWRRYALDINPQQFL